MRTLAASLLTLAATGSTWSAEAQVATPFEVRKEAQELFDDLAKRTPGAEDAALLERVQQLMARSGERLIEAPGSKGDAQPLGEILTRTVTEMGLAQRFAETYGPLAERRLPSSTGRQAETELLTVARSYPTTAAATKAWALLADRAWDQGRLGSFLQRAKAAGEAEAAAGRGRRLSEARQLLVQPPLATPRSLDGIEEMWRQPLDLRSTPSKAMVRQPRPDNRGPVARIAVSRPLGDLLCGSDGNRAFVIDHLVGRELAPPASVGNTALLRRQCQPAVLRDGFAVAGVQDVQRLVLVGLDREGGVRWRVSSPGLGFNPLISAPVAIDQLVAVAMVVADDDAADLRVQAYHQDDGRLAWDVLVARLAGHRPWMFSGDQAYTLIPGLCAIDGRLLVLSNSGMIARLGADGDLQRVWSYRQPGAAKDDDVGAQQSGARMGALISDGHVAVATPADLPGQALIISSDQGPVTYRGDGAGGDVVAIADGRAFLAGARLVAVDTKSRSALWDAAIPGTGAQSSINADLQAVIGNDALIVAGREAIAAYDPATGQLRAKRLLERPIGLGIGEQSLITAADGEGTAYIAAYGGTTSVVERLTANAKQDPNDLRSVVALASIATARDQIDTALGWYDEAFKRGAGAEYAAKAARLVRRRLDLAAAPDSWQQLLARFETLAARDPALQPEVAYWQGRRAEALGDRNTARERYQQAAERAPLAALVTIRDDAAIHLAALAAGGLRRLDAAAPLPWSTRAVERVPLLPAPWNVPSRRGRGLLVAEGLAVGYADGVLTATRLDTGAEAWWRRPQRPLLGVRSRPEQVPDGVTIEIMPGTSAAAAGLQTEDILTRFNGVDIRSFTADLVPAVLAMTVRSPFAAEVRRNGSTLTINGTLGGEMVEPVAINQRSVLVWPTIVGPNQAAMAVPPGARPEGLWVAVHDLATGAELWRHAVPPTTQDEIPARPLLTADDLVILVDGGDLVAIPAHPQANAQTAMPGDIVPVWRLTGQGTLLREAKVIGDKLLWLPDVGHDLGLLVEALSGRILARLPMDATQAPVLLDSDLYARQDDGTLSCWDLGYGRLRWKIPGIARIAAAHGDTLWVVNATGQLVSLDRFSGSVRRLYGEWVGVINGRVAGDRLFLHVTPTATEHALVCLTLSGGTVAWQQNLPGDIARIEPAGEAVGCVLAGTRIEGQPPTPAVALAFGPAGELVRLAELGGDAGAAQVRFLNGGLLLAEADGLRAQTAVIPPAPSPVRQVPEAELVAALAPAGSARYAVSSLPGQGLTMLVEVRHEDAVVRLGRLGPFAEIERAEALRVVLPTDLASQPTAPAGIAIDSQPAPDGTRRWRLTALGGAGPVTAPWQVRVDTASGSDCPPAPWWLRQTWRTVVSAR